MARWRSRGLQRWLWPCTSQLWVAAGWGTWGLEMGAEAGGQSRVGYACDVGCLGGCKEVVTYGVVSDRPACSAWCCVTRAVEPNGGCGTVDNNRVYVTFVSWGVACRPSTLSRCLGELHVVYDDVGRCLCHVARIVPWLWFTRDLGSAARCERMWPRCESN